MGGVEKHGRPSRGRSMQKRAEGIRASNNNMHDMQANTERERARRPAYLERDIELALIEEHAKAHVREPSQVSRENRAEHA